MKEQNYTFLTFNDYLVNNINKTVILRHDVDKLPLNSLLLGKIQNDLELKGSYYFRVVSQSFDINIIKKISELGHEIGYHYETMDTCHGDIDKAYDEFCYNLEELRKIAPINTICMHGSPHSRFDNRAIWSKYNYRDLGIIGEPYFDIDFKEFAYFTDTGRRWNGNKFSVRDKVDSGYNFNFKGTKQIIDNVERLPDKIMFTIHPQRWHDHILPWTKELVWQNVKNMAKYIFLKKSALFD